MHHLYLKIHKIKIEQEIKTIEKKIERDQHQQTYDEMRRARIAERAKWLEKAKQQPLSTTAKDCLNIMKCDPLKATMREQELIPGFKPQPKPELQQALQEKIIVKQGLLMRI